MGRLFAKLYWALRPATSRPTEGQVLGQRIDGLSARVMSLEAELHRLRVAGWPVPPDRVVPIRPSLVDDN